MADILSQADAITRVEELLKDFLGRMGVEASIQSRISVGEEGEVVVYSLHTKDANLLIGQGGSNLLALQHVARLVVRAQCTAETGELPENFDFVLDVNNYRKERESYLQRLAEETLSKVRNRKEEIALKPMSSYERRIIHVRLSQETDVETESVGTGRDRHIVVRPLSGATEDDVVTGSLVF